MRKFILGTDWWDDCDDAVAMRILCRAHKSNNIKLCGIVINACADNSVASLDGFLNLEDVNDIPIGIDKTATYFDGNLTYQNYLEGYATKIRSNDDAIDGVKLYRKILAEANEPIEIMEIGFLQVVSAVLKSGADEISELSGIELFKQKVSRVWVMAGDWRKQGGLENNFCRNANSRLASEYFCSKCPVPVTFLGFEVGVDVISGDTLKEDDFLYRALWEHGSKRGRMSWDPMLVSLAITGDTEKAGYSTVKGYARVDGISGQNFFEANEFGLHEYVVKKYDNSYYKNLINKAIE